MSFISRTLTHEANLSHRVRYGQWAGPLCERLSESRPAALFHTKVFIHPDLELQEGLPCLTSFIH